MVCLDDSNTTFSAIEQCMAANTQCPEYLKDDFIIFALDYRFENEGNVIIEQMIDYLGIREILNQENQEQDEIDDTIDDVTLLMDRNGVADPELVERFVKVVNKITIRSDVERMIDYLQVRGRLE